MATLNFNTASIIANDATESSDGSDATGSSEGSDTSEEEDYMTKYGIVERMDTDEENKRKEATWKWFQENRTSDEEENIEENNEVGYISTDTAESRMRKVRQKMSPELRQQMSPGAQQTTESSDSSTDSPSSKKSRNRQSKRQRDQNQKYKKMFNEMQEKIDSQSELMTQNKKM